MAGLPRVPGKGDPPNPSSVPGNVTASQIAYYGGLRRAVRRLDIDVTQPQWLTWDGKSITGLRTVNGALVAGVTTEQMRRQYAQAFRPEQVAGYARWAQAYPMADPRTWMGLVEHGIDPESEEGQAAMAADMLNQQEDGSYDGLDVKKDVLPDRAQAAAYAQQQAQQRAQAQLATRPGEGLPQVLPGQEDPQAPEQDGQSPLGWLWDHSVTPAFDALQNTTSTALAMMMSGYDGIQAYERTALGGTKKINDFLQREGYDDPESWRARWYFVYGEQAPTQADPLFKELPGADEVILGDGSKSPAWAVPASTPLTQEEMDHLDDLRAKFQSDPDNFNAPVGADHDEMPDSQWWGSVWRQTLPGQMMEHPELYTDESLGGGGWLPNDRLFEGAAEEAGKAYDVRTVAEQDKDATVASEIMRDAQQSAARAGQLYSNPRITTIDQFMNARDIVDADEREYVKTGVMPTHDTPVADGAAVRPGEQPAPLASIDPERQDILDEYRDEYQRAQTVEEAAVSAYNVVYGAPEDYPPDQQKAAKEFLDAYAASGKEVQAAIIAHAVDQAEQVTAPVGWTPGRGVASALGMDVDTVAAQVMSGMVDAANNLTLGDPVNLVPVAKGASLLRAGLEHVPGTLSRALKPAEMAVASIPTSRFVKAGERPQTAVETVVRSGTHDAPTIARARDAGVVTVRDYGGGPARNVLVSQRAWDWLGHGRGQRVVQQVAKMDDWYAIWIASGRKMDIAIAKKLARANTESTVRAALASRMGFELRDANEFGTLGRMFPPMIYKMKGVGSIAGSPTRNSWVRRQFQLAPREEAIDLRDADTAVNELWRWGNGIGMTSEQMSHSLRKVGMVPTGTPMYEAILHDFMGEAAAHLASKNGMTEADAARLVRVFRENTDPIEGRVVGAYANSNVPTALGYNGGRGQAQLLSEQMASRVFLPDYREARRAAGVLGEIRALANSLGIKNVTRSGKLAQPKVGKITGRLIEDDWESRILNATNRITSYWKYSVLVRPAYVIREIGEMTFAASLAGYRSALLTHPIALIGAAQQAAIAKQAQTLSGRLLRNLAEAGQAAPEALREMYVVSHAMRVLAPKMDRTMARIDGARMWEALEDYAQTGHSSRLIDALSTVHGNLNLVDEPLSRQVGRHLTNVSVLQREPYAKSLAEYLQRLHDDIDVRNLVNPEMSFRQVMKAFRDGSRRQRVATNGKALSTQKGEREYIRDLENTARAYTGGDEVLTQAILTGKFEDESILTSKAFRAYIVKRLDEDEEFARALPPTLGVFAPDYGNQVGGMMAGADALVQRFFTSVGELSDVFARAPLLREAYTDSVMDLMPYMTREARANAVKRLRKAGDSKLAWKVQNAPFEPGGTLSIAAVEAISEGYALKEAQRVFYNAYRRQNYAQAMRIVMPFAQATFNTFRRWGELSLANPQMAYRSLKPMNALTQPGSAVIYDVLGAVTGDPAMAGYYTPDRPDLSVDGFFFTDQRSGERVFSYPLLGPMARLLPFMSAPSGTGLISNMDGLNVAGQSASPGAGPFMTFAASMVLPRDTIYEDSMAGALTRFVFPYGTSTADNPVGEAVDAFSPTVLRGLMRAYGSEQDRASLTVQTMGSLASSGGYDLSNPGDLNRLTSDATSVSQGLSLFQALVSTSTPSTVRSSMSVEVDDAVAGRRMALLSVMGDEYRRYIAGDYDRGVQAFVEDNGYGALLGVFPVTDANGAPQATNSVWQFRTDHGDAYDQYQRVVGFFFPGGNPIEDMANLGTGPNDYSMNLRRWQGDSGERLTRIGNDEYRTGSQFVAEAVEQYAWALYNARTQKIASSPLTRFQKDQQMILMRDDIRKQFSEIRFDPSSPSFDHDSTKVMIDEVRNALDADGEIGDAFKQQQSYPYIKKYMETRDEYAAQLFEQKASENLSTKEAKPWRDKLVSLAIQLMEADGSGAFANAWNRLFSRELGDREDY